jgi:hypothetical protein
LAAGSAYAGDVSLGVGGYITTGVGVGPENGDAGTDPQKDFHTIFDGEVHFKGVGTLDNGIQIVTRVELENTSQTDIIDEQWVQVKSQFGTVMIGGNDDAAYNISRRGMTDVGICAGAWAPCYNFTPADINEIGGSDALGVHYYTPNIAGFEAGISWQPTLTDPSGPGPIDTAITTVNSRDRIAVGAAYSNSFGDVAFGIDGRYVRTDEAESAGNDDETGYAIGASVGFSGVTVEGRWEHTDDVSHVAGTDRDRFGGGVTYATGPWTFAAAGAFANTETAAGAETEQTRASVGAKYGLGAGVNLAGVVMYGDIDNPTGVKDEDGFGGALLLGVAF